jgi:hypothetical protein
MLLLWLLQLLPRQPLLLLLLLLVLLLLGAATYSASVVTPTITTFVTHHMEVAVSSLAAVIAQHCHLQHVCRHSSERPPGHLVPLQHPLQPL